MNGETEYEKMLGQLVTGTPIRTTLKFASNQPAKSLQAAISSKLFNFLDDDPDVSESIPFQRMPVPPLVAGGGHEPVRSPAVFFDSVILELNNNLAELMAETCLELEICEGLPDNIVVDGKLF